ncbi:MAG TPA: hypothetical protein VET26_00715 [Candidatus Sulfotelmatobacter sp.]|nr:hypothetical protein [Candidatus Sulfotelmatobacter sp.]
MRCRPYKDEQGSFAGIVCGRKPSAAKCVGCGKPAGLLCDGKKGSKACDAPLCEACTAKQGKKDFCPTCVAVSQAELALAAALPAPADSKAVSSSATVAPTPVAEQLVMCALCSTPTRRTYYWGNGSEGTTLCDPCGAAWSASQDCQQANPAAPIRQWEERFLKWLDAARARLRSKATPPVDKCKSCGAPAYWAKNPETGNSMLVDVEPSPKGNLLLSYKPVAGELLLKFTSSVPLQELERRKRYLPHWSSCPNADAHRKKPAAAGAQP